MNEKKTKRFCERTNIKKKIILVDLYKFYSTALNICDRFIYLNQV